MKRLIAGILVLAGVCVLCIVAPQWVDASAINGGATTALLMLGFWLTVSESQTPIDDKSHPRFVAGYLAGLYDRALESESGKTKEGQS